MVRVGVVGLGRWGPNFVRNFSALPGDAEVTWLCDGRVERLARCASMAPRARTTTHAADVFGAADCDAVAIMTPMATHHALAIAALQAGKHVLVGKPMARSVAEAREMRDVACAVGRVLCVDHTLLFHGAVRAARASLTRGELGRLATFDAERLCVDGGTRDGDALWDLLPHDLAVLDHWGAGTPTTIGAVGFDADGGAQATVARVTIHYDSGLRARVHASWRSARKVRRMAIAGSDRALVLDDDPNTAPLTIHVRTADGARARTPPIDLVEPLARETRHFVDCCRGLASPIAGADAGLRVVRWLEAASRSMALGGAPIVLSHEDAA
jgi:predicted dehydrogenase